MKCLFLKESWSEIITKDLLSQDMDFYFEVRELLSLNPLRRLA